VAEALIGRIPDQSLKLEEALKNGSRTLRALRACHRREHGIGRAIAGKLVDFMQGAIIDFDGGKTGGCSATLVSRASH
jgi:hypothetical protein